MAYEKIESVRKWANLDDIDENVGNSGRRTDGLFDWRAYFRGLLISMSLFVRRQVRDTRIPNIPVNIIGVALHSHGLSLSRLPRLSYYVVLE